MKNDDSSLPPCQLKAVRKHADNLLRLAGAYGVFPTPVSQVIDAIGIEISDEDIFDETFIKAFIRKHGSDGSAVKRALSKVCGLYHAGPKVIYLDPKLPKPKIPFIKLHETAHAFLPWQRHIYAITEDCERTLDANTADIFEREANIFASEIIFQLDGFMEEALSYDLSIRVPLRLQKKYGSSIYSSMRQYVRKNPHPCALVTLDPSVGRDPLRTRRYDCSPAFAARFPKFVVPHVVCRGTGIGIGIPMPGRRMSQPQPLLESDSNGQAKWLLAEGFTQTHQVFVFIRES